MKMIKSKILFFGLAMASFIWTSRVNAQLVLDGAYVNVSGGTSPNSVFLVVDQSNTSGITRLASGGHVYTEGQYNYIHWNAGTGTGNYVFPFGYSNTDFIPFTFNKISASSSNVAVSTWNTDQQNMPHPGISNVAAVHVMKGNGDSITSAIDRFWDIRSTEPATADITFSYRGAENTTSFPTSSFRAQHWNGSLCCGWDPSVGPGNTGVTSGIGIVGPVLLQNSFSPWVLTRGLAPLGITRIYAALTARLTSDYYSTTNGYLFFKYNGEYKSGELVFSVYDKFRNVVLSNSTYGIISPTTINYGDNRLMLNANGLAGGEFYTLEVKDEKNEIYKLKFKREL